MRYFKFLILMIILFFLFGVGVYLVADSGILEKESLHETVEEQKEVFLGPSNTVEETNTENAQ